MNVGDQIHVACPSCGSEFFHVIERGDIEFGMAECICPVEDCLEEFDVDI